MSSQTIKVIWINIISLPTRLRSSIVAIVGSAGVVAVLVTVLAMAQGFEDALKAPNQSNLFVILKGGATTELVSNITSRSALKLRQHSGIEKANTVSQFSSQLLVAISVPMIGKDADANVSLRGVDQSAYKLHHIHLLKGTLPTTGKREVIVGQRAAEQFEGLQVGSLIGSGTNSWKVVGIFDSQGSIHETEIIADVTMVQNAFQRGNTYSSVHGKLSVSAGASIEQIQTLVENDPELDLVLFKADDYYANQSESLSVFIKSIGYSTAFIMAIGAIFASLNTMYGSVSSRKREFGILRALGYSKLSIAISVFFESALLSLLGGLLGCVVVYLILNNYAVSTFNMLSFSQVAFSFSVTKETMFEGLKWALIIGSLGGCLPALQVSKLTVAETMRKHH
ncbi:ABC transporter permease [Shewanella woodyi]|uniref:ABC transporter permease n=1 Tax=Shewanella woodyi TaxID=60961 RepID=UPI0007EBE3F9|nr:FtsX-like permease family protein [Shewanella woodyi]